VSDADRALDVPNARRPMSFPDDNDPLYTVGQVADMLGVQPAFLRRLEAQQAVAPQRSAGGQRRYSRLEIDRIDAINRLLGEGMTVEGAKRIIELQSENARLREQLAVPDPSRPSGH
jgi:MerR family transcriptional regulator, heat shock protein HspR